MSLTIVNDGGIHIGDIVMLKCDGTQAEQLVTLPKPARKDCYLALSTSNALGSTSSRVSSSNAFLVKSVDGSQAGSRIRYGQPFALTNLEGTV